MTVPLLCIAGTLCDSRVFGPMLAAIGAPGSSCAVTDAVVAWLAREGLR